LIHKEGAPHTHVLEPSDGAIIRTILKKHHIVKDENDEKLVDLTPYQPDRTRFALVYNAIFAQERMHERIATPIYVAATVCVGYVAVKSLMYVHKKLRGQE
jgi:hypothetical protein